MQFTPRVPIQIRKTAIQGFDSTVLTHWGIKIYEQISDRVAARFASLPFIKSISLVGGSVHRCVPGGSDLDWLLILDNVFPKLNSLKFLRQMYQELQGNFVILGEPLVWFLGEGQGHHPENRFPGAYVESKKVWGEGKWASIPGTPLSFERNSFALAMRHFWMAYKQWSLQPELRFYLFPKELRKVIKYSLSPIPSNLNRMPFPVLWQEAIVALHTLALRHIGIFGEERKPSALSFTSPKNEDESLVSQLWLAQFQKVSWVARSLRVSSTPFVYLIERENIKSEFSQDYFAFLGESARNYFSAVPAVIVTPEIYYLASLGWGRINWICSKVWLNELPFYSEVSNERLLAMLDRALLLRGVLVGRWVESTSANFFNLVVEFIELLGMLLLKRRVMDKKLLRAAIVKKCPTLAPYVAVEDWQNDPNSLIRLIENSNEILLKIDSQSFIE